MPEVTKTIEYRRVRWIAFDQNLETLARDAWETFPTQAARTISFSGDRRIAGLSCQNLNGRGFAIHCARYTDQQGIGTVPMAPTEVAAIGEKDPEEGENFLNSDFMALIKDNHVVTLNCGRNAASLRNYLDRLFRKAEFEDETHQFEICRIGNPDKIAMIENIGVRMIDMNVSISEATAVGIAEGAHGGGIWKKTKNGIANAVLGIIGEDDNIAGLREAERGMVKVSINVPKGDTQAVRDGLDYLAEGIADDDEAENFVIHLRDGKTTIKSDEVAVRKAVSLQAAANSVSVEAAWSALHDYLDELSDNRQIEV